jgi:hypothetical protein
MNIDVTLDVKWLHHVSFDNLAIRCSELQIKVYLTCSQGT